jgi:hypothetical protein
MNLTAQREMNIQVAGDSDKNTQYQPEADTNPTTISE